jgi:hypothetical protein
VALQQLSSSVMSLQAVPATLAGKENNVAEDSRALAQAGVQLEASCRQLEALWQRRAGADGSSQRKDGEPGLDPDAPLRCWGNVHA